MYREQSREAGDDGHLVKPVALNDLDRLLDRTRTNDDELGHSGKKSE